MEMAAHSALYKAKLICCILGLPSGNWSGKQLFYQVGECLYHVYYLMMNLGSHISWS